MRAPAAPGGVAGAGRGGVGGVRRVPSPARHAGRRRLTVEQMAELARFVDQVNPDVLQQILSMLA
jgi:hypothetical protein